MEFHPLSNPYDAGGGSQGVSEMSQCQEMIFQRSSCRTELGASSASDFREYFFGGPRVNILPRQHFDRMIRNLVCFPWKGVVLYMFFFVAWCVYHWGSGCHSNGNSRKCN